MLECRPGLGIYRRPAGHDGSPVLAADVVATFDALGKFHSDGFDPVQSTANPTANAVVQNLFRYHGISAPFGERQPMGRTRGHGRRRALLRYLRAQADLPSIGGDEFHRFLQAYDVFLQSNPNTHFLLPHRGLVAPLAFARKYEEVLLCLSCGFYWRSVHSFPSLLPGLSSCRFLGSFANSG